MLRRSSREKRLRRCAERTASHLPAPSSRSSARATGGGRQRPLGYHTVTSLQTIQGSSSGAGARATRSIRLRVGKPRRRTSHRRPAAGSVVTAFPGGCGRETRWSYGKPGTLALRRRGEQRSAGPGEAFSHPGGGGWAASSHEFCGTTGVTPQLQGHTRTYPGSDARRNGPLRVLESVDGHAGLHGPRGKPGIKGCLDGAGRSRPRSAPAVHGGRGALRCRRHSRVLRRVPGRPDGAVPRGAWSGHALSRDPAFAQWRS